MCPLGTWCISPAVSLSCHGINKYLLFGMPYGLNFRLGVVESNGQKITLMLYCQLGALNDVKPFLKGKKSNCIALMAVDSLIWAQVRVFFFSASGQNPPLPTVWDSHSTSPLWDTWSETLDPDSRASCMIKDFWHGGLQKSSLPLEPAFPMTLVNYQPRIFYATLVNSVHSQKHMGIIRLGDRQWGDYSLRHK